MCASASSPPPPPTCHPKFYFQDGSVIFLVEDILYKLHISLLKSTSEVLQNMLTMPVGEVGEDSDMGDHAEPEGRSDQNPIQLTAPFTGKKFDDLLSWFYQRGPLIPALDVLKSILELATFLQMDMAQTYAIQALTMPAIALSASLHLSLALNYRVSEWIEPAFRKLLAVPTNMISLEDFTLLGPPVSHLLVATQAAIRSHRLIVTYNPLKPMVHDPACGKGGLQCQCNWEAAWWDGLARHYLHPDFPPSPYEIVAKLENTPIAGVITACQLQSVEVIKQQRVFEKEDDMIQEALGRLRDFEGTVFCG